VTYKRYCVVSALLFTLVAIAHLLRIEGGLAVHVGEYEVPMLVSWIGLIVPGLLAVWGFRASRG